MLEQRARHLKDRCFSQTQKAVENVVKVEEVISAKAKEDQSVGISKVNQTFGKKTETLKEPSEEGGVPMPNKVGKSGPLLATIVATREVAHFEEECRKKRSELASTSQQVTNYV